MHRRLIPGYLVAATVLLGIAVPAHAVLLYSTGVRNTDPPGSLANRDTLGGPIADTDPRRLLNSGWQYEGEWGDFLGTPISSQYFVTARHVGGSIGGSFVYNGVTYTTTNSWEHHLDANDAGSPLMSDLKIWKISGTFPTWAPMYNTAVDGTEIGKSLVVIGRSGERGSEITVSGQLKGWGWAGGGGPWSWGENVVSHFAGYQAQNHVNSNVLLGFDFNKDAGPNEAAMAGGDSGGAVFIQSNGVWKLAGINYAVDGPFRFSADGENFNASIFDAFGLYAQLNTAGVYEEITQHLAGSSYASRISAEMSWINGIIGSGSSPIAVPEPTTGLLLFPILLSLSRRRR